MKNYNIKKSNIFKAFFYFLMGGVFLYLINKDLIDKFISLPYITGWDGASHEGLLYIYSKDIFPSFWGWTNAWYAGMPFPQFYPPAMYYIGSLIIHLGFSSITSFKILSFFCLLSVFCSLLYLIKKILKTKQIIIPFLVVAILSINSDGGVTVESIMKASMLGQAFSALGFIFFIFLLNKPRNFINFFLSVLCVSLAVIGNAHLFLCLIIFTSIWSFLYFLKNPEDFKRNLLYVFIIFLTSFFLTTFWSLPMLSNLEWSSSLNITLQIQIDGLVKNAWPILLLSVLGFIPAIKEKNNDAFYLYLTILLSFLFTLVTHIIIISYDTHLPIPIHIFRWYATFLFLCVIPLSHFFIFLFKKNKIAILLPILLILWIMHSREVSGRKELGIYRYYGTDIELLAEKISKPGSLIMVDSDFKNELERTRVLSYDGIIGKKGGETTFTSLRESSISSIILRIIRNNLSQYNVENWSLNTFVERKLTQPSDYYDLLRFIGVQALVYPKDTWDKVNDKNIKKNFNITEFKNDFILELKKETPRSVEVVRPLTIAFTDTGFKERKKEDINFTKISEIILQNELWKKTQLFKPNSKFLDDTILELDNSRYIILDKYKIKDKKIVVKKLYQLLEKDAKIFLSEEDTILKKHLDKKPGVYIENKKNILLRYIEEVKKAENKTDLPLKLTSGKNYFSLETKKSNKKITPILLKYSYFPSWKILNTSKNIERTYLTFPTYNLIFSDKKNVELYFETPKSVILGHTISLLTLLLLAILTFYNFFREKKLKT